MRSIWILFSLFLLVLMLAVGYAFVRPRRHLPLTPGDIQIQRFAAK